MYVCLADAFAGRVSTAENAADFGMFLNVKTSMKNEKKMRKFSNFSGCDGMWS